jgi:heterodisulfide reductase subunit C
LIGSALFIIILAFVGYKSYFGFKQLYDNVHLGKPEELSDQSGVRWKNVVLIALVQKKMFTNFTPAILHLFIYVAFLFTQLELIEIIIDGVFGSHRFFSHFLGGLYTALIWSIEILSLLALVGTIVFLWRRNILKVPRLVMNELSGWPKFDANLILILEIFLVIGIFSMNSADGVLQTRIPDVYHPIGGLPISPIFGFFMNGLSNGALIAIERFGWWLHVLIVFVFILYLPLSKHLHIFLAFPNVYFSRLTSRGEMKNMPIIMNEVKSMMDLPIEGAIATPSEADLKFGANDVMDLSWKNILDAYSCSECGRCTSQCPANITGKKLSPRKIMMDVRDRATEIGKNIKSGNIEFIQAVAADKTTPSKENYSDGKSLFDTIIKEEIRACTTCNACVEACPILINPLDIILQLRRYEVLTESNPPQEWTPMFTSLENSGAVWQVSDSRTKWIEN